MNAEEQQIMRQTILACARVARSAAKAERESAESAIVDGDEDGSNMRLHAARCLEELALGFEDTALTE